MERQKKESKTLSSPSAGFMRPEKILGEVGVHTGMRVADFGSGAGYFAIPLAKLVGDEGVVYAVDIQKPVLESVQSRVKLFTIFNIQIIRGDLEKESGSTLEAESVDMVLCANVLYQARDKKAIIVEAKRVLVKNGRLIVIEWNTDSSALGPALKLRIPVDSLKSLAEKEGFIFKKEFDAGNHHYGLVFEMKP